MKFKNALKYRRWAFFVNPFKEEALEYAKDLEILLADRGIEVHKFFRPSEDEGNSSKLESAIEGGALYDVVLVFGGDGTFYRAAKTFFRVPIATVNFGAKGFLCTFNPWSPLRLYRRISSALLRKSFIEFRPLHMFIDGRREHIVIGDLVVVHDDFGKTIRIELKLDDIDFTVSGDGIIVATSAGSTGYAFSIGGPLVDIRLSSITVAFMAPHNPFTRPMVLNINRKITVFNRSHVQKAKVIVDGEEVGVLKKDEGINLEKAEFTVKLLVPTDFDMISKWKTVFMLGKI